MGIRRGFNGGAAMIFFADLVVGACFGALIMAVFVGGKAG